MATACLDDCLGGFAALERDYIRQDYALQPGQSRPTPEALSDMFGRNLQGRIQAWSTAADASARLAEEFAHWVERPNIGQVLPL